jgi:hypothetical protein
MSRLLIKFQKSIDSRHQTADPRLQAEDIGLQTLDYKSTAATVPGSEVWSLMSKVCGYLSEV